MITDGTYSRIRIALSAVGDATSASGTMKGIHIVASITILAASTNVTRSTLRTL